MRRKHIHHILWGAHQVGIIPGKIEVSGVSPKAKALLINRHQTTGSINDGPALTKGLRALGLKPSGLLLEGRGLHQLQPCHAAHKAHESCAED